MSRGSWQTFQRFQWRCEDEQEEEEEEEKIKWILFFPFAARTPLITSSQIEATKDWDRAATLPVVVVICCLSAGEIKNT